MINDFCKLLTVKAPIKIMLFQGRGDPEEYVEALGGVGCRWLQHDKDDVIYVINFAKGQHITWFFKTETAGRIENSKFRRIDELTGPDNLG